MQQTNKPVPMGRKLFPPHLFIRKNDINSTNNLALELTKSNKPLSGTVILALNQSEGRGQGTNVWESEYGKNLTISIILEPKFLAVAKQFQVSIVISLGIYDYLRNYLDNVSIKWPNDIYVGDGKIAGILIEHSIMGAILNYSICGIGLNINQKIFLSDAPNPVSLAILTKQEYNLEGELSKLLDCIEKRYFQLVDGEHDALADDYLHSMYWINETHFFTDGKEEFEGEITGITELGQLRIDVHGEERVYNFKEVGFVG